MADALVDGNVRVFLCASIANIAAPTTTELNAGTDISNLLTPDGLSGFAGSTAAVDASKINSTYNATSPGRVSWSGPLLRLVRQTGTDTVYNLLVRGYFTNVAVRRAGIAYGTAWTTGQPLMVYPSICGEMVPVDAAANELEKYEIPLFFNPVPNQRAAVA